MLDVCNVHRTFPGPPEVNALRGVDLQVFSGERVVIVGPSGAGKSTLLNTMGLLDRPTAGRVDILGRETAVMRGKDVDHLRSQQLGFVFQESHILGQRTVAENLEVALAISRVPAARRRELIPASLEQVGLTGRRDAMARLLSGGEKQRLAVARASITAPALLLADEPTGNLDDDNARTILSLFDHQARGGTAVVVITHDPRISDWADRILRLDAGVLVDP